jgi:HSP20 family molecular chaperone IbpA
MGDIKKHKTGDKIIVVPPDNVSEGERSICIICQMQGVPEEEIRVDLEGTQLIISTPVKNATVMRKIVVPEGSTISKKKVRDGVLELILKRPE